MKTCKPSRNVAQLRQGYIPVSPFGRQYNVSWIPGSQLVHHESPNPHNRLHSRYALSAVKHIPNPPCALQTIAFHFKRPFSHTHRQYQPLKCLTSIRSSSSLVSPNHESVFSKFKRDGIDTTSGIGEWTELEQYENVGGATLSHQPKHITIHGYITAHRVGKKVDFLTMVDPYLQKAIQIVCSKSVLSKADGSEPDAQGPKTAVMGSSIRPHTPVSVSGTIVESEKRPAGMREGSNTVQVLDQSVGNVLRIGHVELQASCIKVLNDFPPSLVAKTDTNFSPDKRHLQMRTDAGLRASMRLRSKVKNACTSFLLQNGFDDIETPLLFKSTPEGAREFVVPTRRAGFAYALPQSPQQYKQILMASGIPRYFQFAKCFRDEDLRADRQPEFTQLDLEMSFAKREHVMLVVEKLILDIVWPIAGRTELLPGHLRPRDVSKQGTAADSGVTPRLPIYTYQEAMTKYGTDKPDPRLGAEIVRVEEWIPSSLKKMLTDIEDPIVEMIRITTKEQNPGISKQFIASFMDLPTSAAYMKGAYGMAGVSVYDPAAPLRGLAAFGHEAADMVEETFEPEEGDILVAQVRPKSPFFGGSTVLGDMRRDLLHHAAEQNLIEPAQHDALFWVVDFPLFSPIEDGTPGQEGEAGICSTHHPFTAPREGQDLTSLLHDPLSIIGDHYDLVINGTEVGGGSRRIHHSQMQEIVFRDVLKMKAERVEDFRHLLDVLGAGCPPHAGLALGFDRLMALLLNKSTVRDVIAFPKWGDGEDKLIGSPSRLTASQLGTYHLTVEANNGETSEPRLSIKA